VSIALKK